MNFYIDYYGLNVDTSHRYEKSINLSSSEMKSKEVKKKVFLLSVHPRILDNLVEGKTFRYNVILWTKENVITKCCIRVFV